MCDALGIIISSALRGRVKGLQDHRPMGAFSFMGRYRVIDFPLSNFSNSDIDHIQVYVRENPRSLAEHLSNESSFDINAKKGKLQLLFSEKNELNDVYNTDIAAFEENINIIKRSRQKYVVVVPSYMIYKQDFSQLVQEHIESGADVSLLYQHVNNAKEAFINCNVVDLNKQKGVLSISRNKGTANSRNILLDTAIMSKEVFLDMIDKAHKLSAMSTLGMTISSQASELDIRGIAHRGYVATVTDLRSYLEANLNLLDPETAASLFTPDWPIYTVTTDAPPTRYIGEGDAVNSVVSNGCTIKGHVENSVIGRGVTIEEGAVIKNSVVLAYSKIGKGVTIEYQVIDKWAQIKNAKELIGSPENPGYIKRDDIL
ncbi:MAG: glucose-1-phosphate adenylyltransferase subunit GlgD [Eubacterium sp.]|nr:glucose-1-phosphate adenylyltransferase subunit GlgD [Eubacterium sp.]